MVRLRYPENVANDVAIAWGAWLALPFDSTHGDSDALLGSAASYAPEWAIGAAMMIVGIVGIFGVGTLGTRARWALHAAETWMWLVISLALFARNWRDGLWVTTLVFTVVSFERAWRFAVSQAES